MRRAVELLAGCWGGRYFKEEYLRQQNIYLLCFKKRFEPMIACLFIQVFLKRKMMKSAHLTNIIEKHNRTSTIAVVFVDVEKYSMRRTVNQIAVVDAFTACLKAALQEISKSYINYAQVNNLNFDSDVIKLPTGDGAAIIFPFEGLHDVHLHFARTLLRIVDEKNRENSCEKFSNHGWCNCHQNFNLTVGISEGKGIIYTDINDNYNVAGAVVNMAARVMSKADRNQIILTQEAYNQLIEMDEDVSLVDRFQRFEVEIKHGLKIQIYQYCNQEDTFINCSPPKKLALVKRGEEILNTFRQFGFPVPDPDFSLNNIDQDAMMNSLEEFAKLFSKGTFQLK